MKEVLVELFGREFTKLETEISSYLSDEDLWGVSQKISNSGGNLCLHLLGNLNTFIGNGLGGYEYIRDREKEFSTKGLSKNSLIALISETKIKVLLSIEKIEEHKMSDDFPVLIWEKPRSVAFTLTHLISHFNYHLGQINYHRRLKDSKNLDE